MLEHFSETNEENWYCHTALNYFINNLITAPLLPPSRSEPRGGSGAHSVFLKKNVFCFF